MKIMDKMVRNDDGSLYCEGCGETFMNGINYGDILKI